jgi:DEAD/DEAH box helicase
VLEADLTIDETVTSIRSALQDYIEATYHVGHPAIVAQRRTLLELEGVLHRAPYIESTPRYQAAARFGELDLPDAALSLLSDLANPLEDATPLVFDPPYTHQATALEAVCSQDRSLVVTTGTGSGKTETFLLPILARLATEAAERSESFKTPALRALLLYPMNALVNDQLGRLRLLFGSPLVSSRFEAWAGRPARFARYTSRTLYPGVRKPEKDSRRLRAIQHFYIALLEQASDDQSPNQDQANGLIDALRARGKWPAKPDLQAWFGPSGSRWRNKAGEFVRAVTLPQDPELFTRHEVLANPPMSS